jgi:hypothetical protein
VERVEPGDVLRTNNIPVLSRGSSHGLHADTGQHTGWLSLFMAVSMLTAGAGASWADLPCTVERIKGEAVFGMSYLLGYYADAVNQFFQIIFEGTYSAPRLGFLVICGCAGKSGLSIHTTFWNSMCCDFGCCYQHPLPAGYQALTSALPAFASTGNTNVVPNPMPAPNRRVTSPFDDATSFFGVCSKRSY